MIKYTVLEQASETATADIRIDEGKFKDFVYNYGVVTFKDTEEGILSYNYDLKQAPEDFKTDNEEADKKEFETLIGDILVEIISEFLKEKEGESLGNRDVDSKQPSP